MAINDNPFRDLDEYLYQEIDRFPSPRDLLFLERGDLDICPTFLSHISFDSLSYEQG
jgi:hypothetical protein